MPARRDKTLHYRCAIWFEDAQTLESYVRNALQQLPTAEDRTVEAGEDHFIRCLHARRRHNGGVFLHITADTPGESATTVPKQLNAADVDVGQAPPPADGEFMDGDIFVFVRDNHVCFCSGSGLMREGSLQRFLAELFDKAGLGENSAAFVLEKVADAQALALIEAQGVKRISLNASVYAAVTHYAGRNQQPVSALMQAGRRLYNAVWADDNEDRNDNLLLQVSVQADGRIKANKELGFQRLEELARQIVQTEQDGDDYTIITNDDQRISPGKFSLQKTVSLPALGKSVSREPTWSELMAFYHGLRADHQIVAP